MSPRFPQEIFDYIIDHAKFQDDVLKTYSTVCKGWAVRSRSHLFEQLHFPEDTDLELWCKGIPPTIDGPSRYVKTLYIYSEVIPLVREPQPLDPYLAHFSALTHVTELTLAGYRGKVHLDLVLQCCSGFKNTLRWLKLSSNSFRFEEMSRIMEFFPNLETLILWSPNALRSDEKEPLQPPRQAVFPSLKNLHINLFSRSPPLERHLLSGFAEASMDLEALSIVGHVSDPSAVQKIVDSSAKTLEVVGVSPLELDLSACNKIQCIEVEDLLNLYWRSYHFYDSPTRPQFEHMLNTIQSPTLCGICVRVKSHQLMDGDDEIALPQSDWKGVDTSLCELLIRVRRRAEDPSWTFEVGITGCVLHDIDDLQDTETLLPDFQAMGGVVTFSVFED